MQYILTESEYQDFLASKDKVQVLEHRLAVANEVREANLTQIKQLNGLVCQGKQSIKERDQRIADLKHARDLDYKALTNKSHELLAKEAELAELSSKLRESQRDMAGTCSALAKAKILNDSRLRSINYLRAEVHRLRNEKVCIATNIQTNVVKIVPAIKADTYRKLGWIVSGEEFSIDRSDACEPFDWSGTPGV